MKKGEIKDGQIEEIFIKNLKDSKKHEFLHEKKHEQELRDLRTKEREYEQRALEFRKVGDLYNERELLKKKLK